MIHIDELLTVNEPINENLFPDIIHIGKAVCTVSYLFEPGDPNDGAVITVGLDVFESVPTFYWEWVLPAFWKQRIEIVIKEIRTQLIEISLEPEIVADELHSKLLSANGTFVDTLCSLLYNNYEITVYPSDIRKIMQISFLWPIIKVIDHNGLIVQSYRTFFSDPEKSSSISEIRAPFWADECSACEQHRFTSWSVPFLEPRQIKSEKQDVPLLGFPALHCENGGVATRVFFSYSSASCSHAWGFQKLLEDELAEMFGWELENIAISAKLLHKGKLIWPEADLTETVKALVVARTLQLPDILPCDESAFKKLSYGASVSICKSIAEVMDALEKVVNSHEICRLLLVKKNLKYGNTYLGSIYDELCDLLNGYCAAFLCTDTPVAYRLHIPVILSEFTMRIEMAYNDPAKYRLKMKIRSFLIANLERIMSRRSTNSYQIQRKNEAIRIMIEDFIINQFTAQTVKKFVQPQQSDIQEKLEELRHELEIPEVFELVQTIKD
jgi:hypothetical protein